MTVTFTNRVMPCSSKFQVSDDGGSTFEEYAGFLTVLDGWMQERITGQENGMGMDTPVIGLGPKNPITLSITAFYSPTTGDLYDTVKTQFDAECGGNLIVQWGPTGFAPGSLVHTTNVDNSYVSALALPPFTASDAKPLLFQFKIFTTGVDDTTIPIPPP